MRSWKLLFVALGVLGALAALAQAAQPRNVSTTNNFIEIHLTNVLHLGIKTAFGRPGDTDDNKQMVNRFDLFDRHPLSNKDTLQVDGNHVLFQDATAWDTNNFPGITGPSTISGSRVDLDSGVQVFKKVQITDEVTGFMDTAKITYTVSNTWSVLRQVAIRMELDVSAGDNPNAPVYVDGKPLSYREQEYHDANVPLSWFMIERLDPANTGVVVRGTVQGYDTVSPQRFGVASGADAQVTLWDYTFDTNRQIVGRPGETFAGDSAIIQWWPRTVIKASSRQSFVTYYGLSSVDADESNGLAGFLTSPERLMPAASFFDAEPWSQDPFWVSLVVANRSGAPIDNVGARIDLPLGLELAPSGPGWLQQLGQLAPEEVRLISWLVRTTRYDAGLQEVKVLLAGRNVQPFELRRSIDLPAHPDFTPLATPSPSPTPSYTPTETTSPTPTFTVTPSPTATPDSTEFDYPNLLGGNLATDLAVNQPGNLTFTVLALPPTQTGSPAVGQVELYVAGAPTGTFLPSTGEGAFTLSVPGVVVQTPTSFILEALGRQTGSSPAVETFLWPYLEIR